MDWTTGDEVSEEAVVAIAGYCTEAQTRSWSHARLSGCAQTEGILILMGEVHSLPAWINDPPKDAEQAWSRFAHFLNTLPTHAERDHARRLFLRRLRHPELAEGTIAYGEAEIRQFARPASYNPPPGSSPPCVCGASRGRHDPMTGERPGCNGYFPEPV